MENREFKSVVVEALRCIVDQNAECKGEECRYYRDDRCDPDRIVLDATELINSVSALEKLTETCSDGVNPLLLAMWGCPGDQGIRVRRPLRCGMRSVKTDGKRCARCWLQDVE